MATHSSVLAWRIPGMGSLVGCRLWVAQSQTRLKLLSSSSRSGIKSAVSCIGRQILNTWTTTEVLFYSLKEFVSDSVRPIDGSPPGFPSMGFSRQEYWSELPFPPPGDLLDPGIKCVSPVISALQAVSLPLRHQGSPLRSIDIPLTDDIISFFFLPSFAK